MIKILHSHSGGSMKSKKSHQEWESLVSQYKKTGNTLNGFCREYNLKPSTFIYWVKKLAKSDQHPIHQFVKISSPIKSDEKIKILCKNISFEIPIRTESSDILKIISVVRGL